jgi:polyhydroxyalkanoate synthesis regulator phasin
MRTVLERSGPVVIEDIKKTFEAVIGQLSPAKAQELAKRYLEPGAAKEQVAKAAGDLIDLSQRLRDAVRKEVASQMRSMGAATQDELDSLRKRVRDLERAAGMTASGGTKAARKSGARKPGARTPTSRKKTTARRTSSKTTASRRKTSSAR